jgi:NSS family neurotransmitter:Na+ symporter
MGGTDFFISYTCSPAIVLLYTLITFAVCYLIVAGGIEAGIEKFNKIGIPALFIILVAIIVYNFTLPGSSEGLVFMFTTKGMEMAGTEFNFFAAARVAAGQMLFSCSLGMGIMITYGSYMKKDVSLEKSVKQIELFDTGIAFFAGLMIIPAVFAFSGGNQEALSAGPGLMFVTLPKVFDSMTGGAVIGAVFFVLVLFAALTSSISLMETVVSIFMDKFGWKRRTTCVLVFLLCIALGLPSCLGYGLLGNVKIIGMQFLDFFDFISNSIIMPIVALLTCILIGYVIKPKALIEEIELGGKFKRKALFTVVIKYIAPICIVLILFSSLFMSL